MPPGTRPATRQRQCVALALMLLGWSSLSFPAADWRVDTWTSRAGLPSDSLNMVLPLQDGHLLVTSFYEQPTLFDGFGFSPLPIEGEGIEILRGASVALQTEDGALWFGTRERGLVRVDGNGELLAITLPTNDGPPDVRALAVGRSGTLHVGTSSGLYAIEDPLGGRMVRSPTSDFEQLPVSALMEDPTGRLWIGTDRGLYWRQSGRNVRVDEGRLDTYIWSLHQDPEGALWVGTRGNGLARLQSGQWRFYNVGNGFPNNVARQVVDDGRGGIWVATSGGGLAHLRQGEVDAVANAGNGLQGDTYYWLYLDDTEALWAAGPGTGLVRLRPSAFSAWRADQGLASAFVWSLHEDRLGRLWAGTNAGISYRQNGRSHVIGAVGPGYRAVVRSLLDQADGSMLVATEGGLFSWNGEAFGLYESTRDRQIWSLSRDDVGQTWAGGDRLYRIEGDSAIDVGNLPWPASDRIVALYPDHDALVLLTQRNGLWRRDEAGFQQLAEQQMTLQRSMWLDPDGRRWIAGSSFGWLDTNGKLHPLTAFQRAYGRGLHAMLADDVGGLWVPGNVGLFRFDVAELQRFAAGLAPEPAARRFELSDGLTSTEFNGGGQSPAIKDREGKLWFATTNGVSAVDPRQLRIQQAPLRALITGVESDDDLLSTRLARSLRPGTRRVGIRYTALPASAGGDARFRYRLRPLIDNWVDVGESRHALFPALGPGSYQFEVEAYLPGTGTPTALAQHEFSIQPRLIERRSVQLAALLTALLALSALPLAHIRALRGQRRRLLEEVADKTLALERLASTDALTGLANRRVFDASLARLLDTGQKPALLLMDVDHFKRYNDALGHQAGDQCLREVAAILNHAVRHELDLAARVGGEEFALLIPAADSHAANALANRVRDLLRSRGMAHPDSPLGALVTISIGHACSKASETPDTLYRRADAALYAAKKSGRDCVAGEDLQP